MKTATWRQMKGIWRLGCHLTILALLAAVCFTPALHTSYACSAALLQNLDESSGLVAQHRLLHISHKHTIRASGVPFDGQQSAMPATPAASAPETPLSQQLEPVRTIRPVSLSVRSNLNVRAPPLPLSSQWPRSAEAVAVFCNGNSFENGKGSTCYPLHGEKYSLLPSFCCHPLF